MTVAVLTIDQQDSSSGPDLVPALLDRLVGLPAALPFERTAGDEVQGVLDDPASVAGAVELLLRAGAWNVGVGFGAIDDPPPPHARAGRGPAYLAAREAVTAAKNSPWRLRVTTPEPELARGARSLETTCWLWAAVLARRTPRGWEVADLVDEGLTYEQAGTRLGITQSAVSQRAQAAGIVEGRRARELVTSLAADLLGKDA